MEIRGYKLAGTEKLQRAIEGMVMREGKVSGGVGDEDPDKLLAEYDRLGGLLLKDGVKVPNGLFWDFKNNKARELEEVDDAEAEAKKAEKEAEKAARKAEKEAAKEAALAEKEAAKEARKVAREAKKAKNAK